MPLRILLGAALLGCLFVPACEATPGGSPARPPTSVAPVPPSVSAFPDTTNADSDPDPFGANISVGMSEAQVRERLGEPDEVRPNTIGIVGATYKWAFGASEDGAFAARGLVLFSDKKTVFMVRSPFLHQLVRPAARHIPWSDEAVASPTGMVCRLESATRDATGAPDQVTLYNTGQQTFRYQSDTIEIRFHLVVELFDANKQPLARKDWASFHSPYESDPSKWPVLEIAPGQKQSAQLGRVGPCEWKEFGALPPGRYHVRVAFPFGDRLYPSNPVAFTLPPSFRCKQ